MDFSLPPWWCCFQVTHDPELLQHSINATFYLCNSLRNSLFTFLSVCQISEVGRKQSIGGELFTLFGIWQERLSMGKNSTFHGVQNMEPPFSSCLLTGFGRQDHLPGSIWAWQSNIEEILKASTTSLSLLLPPAAIFGFVGIAVADSGQGFCKSSCRRLFPCIFAECKHNLAKQRMCFQKGWRTAAKGRVAQSVSVESPILKTKCFSSKKSDCEISTSQATGAVNERGNQ